MSEKIEFNGRLETPQTTEKVPVVPFKVVEAGIPFFTDPACTEMVDDACLYILEGLDPDDPVLEMDIVPSTNTYKKGNFVRIGYDNKKLWEDCWFRDPDSGEIQKAWGLHTNFIGEVIKPEAIAADQTRIDNLEKKMTERKGEVERPPQ